MKTLLRIESKTGTVCRSTEFPTYRDAYLAMTEVVRTWEERHGWTPETTAAYLDGHLIHGDMRDQHTCIYVWRGPERVARVELFPEGCPGHPEGVRKIDYHYI